jgi:hypothetical protein
MSSNASLYSYTADEVSAFKRLAHTVLLSKQNVGQEMRDMAEIVKRITQDARTILPKAKGLEPHEICLMCGTIGMEPALKVKRQPLHPTPKCPLCQEPFTRGRKWRLFRGKRVHCDCV